MLSCVTYTAVFFPPPKNKITSNLNCQHRGSSTKQQYAHQCNIHRLCLLGFYDANGYDPPKDGDTAPKHVAFPL